MVTLDIDGKKYEVPTEWKDITLSYWCGWYEVIRKHEQICKASMKDDEEYNSENPLSNLNSLQIMNLNVDIFKYITKIDDEAVKNINVDSILNAMEFIGKLTEEYVPEGLDGFLYEDKKYFFPKEAMYNNTFGDYIEATQLDMTIESMKHGIFDVLPEQMAILCREAGEKYDENLVKEKTEKFKNLTMDTIWEFSFFLSIQSLRLTKVFQMYSEKGAEKHNQVELTL